MHNIVVLQNAQILLLQEFLTEVVFVQGPVMNLTDIHFTPEHWRKKRDHLERARETQSGNN